MCLFGYAKDCKYKRIARIQILFIQNSLVYRRREFDKGKNGCIFYTVKHKRHKSTDLSFRGRGKNMMRCKIITTNKF